MVTRQHLVAHSASFAQRVRSLPVMKLLPVGHRKPLHVRSQHLPSHALSAVLRGVPGVAHTKLRFAISANDGFEQRVTSSHVNAQHLSSQSPATRGLHWRSPDSAERVAPALHSGLPAAFCAAQCTRHVYGSVSQHAASHEGPRDDGAMEVSEVPRSVGSHVVWPTVGGDLRGVARSPKHPPRGFAAQYDAHVSRQHSAAHSFCAPVLPTMHRVVESTACVCNERLEAAHGLPPGDVGALAVTHSVHKRELVVRSPEQHIMAHDSRVSGPFISHREPDCAGSGFGRFAGQRLRSQKVVHVVGRGAQHLASQSAALVHESLDDTAIGSLLRLAHWLLLAQNDVHVFVQHTLAHSCALAHWVEAVADGERTSAPRLAHELVVSQKASQPRAWRRVQHASLHASSVVHTELPDAVGFGSGRSVLLAHRPVELQYVAHVRGSS